MNVAVGGSVTVRVSVGVGVLARVPSSIWKDSLNSNTLFASILTVSFCVPSNPAFGETVHDHSSPPANDPTIQSFFSKSKACASSLARISSKTGKSSKELIFMGKDDEEFMSGSTVVGSL